MKPLYTFFIHSYSFAIKIASLFNSKAKLWLRGRKDIFSRIEKDFLNAPTNTDVVWVHCASLGEFEQGRPLIEKIKRERADAKIVLTFFSPSGYEIRKNYNLADYIYYLPADTPTNARQFIELIKPTAAVFVKYEFWFNYLQELKNNKIPTYLICGIFREQQYFFKSYGNWGRNQLKAFTHFYLQDKISEQLLNSIGYKNTSVDGDTRFDRVFEIAANAKEIESIKEFVADKKVLIAGSTWPEDIRILSEFDFKSIGFKAIIAPHEISETSVNSTILQFNSSAVTRYSQITNSNIFTSDILIIDNIGMLSSLYQYGSVAFIGGGFGKGIHNILEAATFGLPVVFGPNYHKFNEAKELIALKGAFSIDSPAKFHKIITHLLQDNNLKITSTIAKDYVRNNAGATGKIFNSIFASH